MFNDVIDAAGGGRVAALGRRVLEGARVSRPEALELFGIEDQADLVELLAWANRIRARFKGNRVALCSIVNAKAGRCSEDCRFCAQSGHYRTASPSHGFVDSGVMRRAAAEAERWGVGALALVAAWRGLSEGRLFDEVCERIGELAGLGTVRPDASLGILSSQAVADRLRAAGLRCYNHNLETSRRFFPQLCSTHTYEERLQTLRFLRNAGIAVCSGGILGLGETREDRCDLALTLREVGADAVPINFLNPIPGTPLAGTAPVPPMELLKTIACFRFILPTQHLVIAGGRSANLRQLQSLVFMAGASGLMVGGYLTTAGPPLEQDLQMIRDLGLDRGATPAHPLVLHATPRHPVGGAR